MTLWSMNHAMPATWQKIVVIPGRTASQAEPGIGHLGESQPDSGFALQAPRNDEIESVC